MKTCTICHYFEDDWNKYGDCWCNKYHLWVDPKKDADNCDGFDPEQSSGGLCYLTTACCENRGLPDDCHELTALRFLRDNYMQTFAQGKLDAAMYYKTAPMILEAINADSNRKEILNKLYGNVIVPCMCFVDLGEYDKAYHLYKEMVEVLTKEYLDK